jgi:YD repeat-containing protein
MKKIVYELQNSNSQFVSKNLKKLIATLFIIVAASCSKDDSVVNKYRLIEDSGSEIKFQYDTQGRLAKETDLTGLERCTYSYNTQNQLTTYISSDYTDLTTTVEEFTYKSNGQLSEKIIKKYSDTDVELSKVRKVYLYNADNLLIEIKTTTWNGLTNTYENEITQAFTYDNLKRLLVNNFGYTHSYDANSNLIKLEGVDKGNRLFTIQYTYNDKINPYYNLRPIVSPNAEIINPKNIATKIATGTFASNYNYIYEYNDGGYPTKKTSLDGDFIYKYEKI